jgi:hypothetical protein
MSRLGYNPETPAVPDFSNPKETPAQGEARIQSELLKITTRLGGTDLTPNPRDYFVVNAQRKNGNQNHR